ncbi:uncharacterized protein LOC120796945 isoform X2 [Xiphias gladius]|uniref:uncharacterized protein LOC120796945 isoform X2 n=1 Tax=Xiphias gladius TaxID=8245 RepID=UPI001A997A56|nr:uncharacterized protein LOC120796945 isoform X2 [Xiphias gladius]
MTEPNQMNLLGAKTPPTWHLQGVKPNAPLCQFTVVKQTAVWSTFFQKVWLSKEGSPSSRITRASFTNQRTIDKVELSGFRTRF